VIVLLVGVAAVTPTGADVAASAADQLPQYGVLGLACLVLGWFSWSGVRRERLRADAAETDRTAMNTAMRDQVVPALIRSTDTTARATEVLAEAVSVLRELARERKP